MKIRQKLHHAFTLIELLVVIAIIAILASLAVPAITGALLKGQLTQTVNNGRQVYLAAFQMGQDAQVQGDAKIGLPSKFTSITSYVKQLMAYEYLKTTDVIKVFNAPGIDVWDGTPDSFKATNSAFKIYTVTEADGSSNVFCVTKNYTYNQTLAVDSKDKPYGGKAFVVVRMGGDGASYKRQQAQNIQAIGLLPGRTDFTKDTTESSGVDTLADN